MWGRRSYRICNELPERVNVAFGRSVRHLVSRHAEDGSWQKEDKVPPLRRLALCTYVLVPAGTTTADKPNKRNGYRGPSRSVPGSFQVMSTSISSSSTSSQPPSSTPSPPTLQSR